MRARVHLWSLATIISLGAVAHAEPPSASVKKRVPVARRFIAAGLTDQPYVDMWRHLAFTSEGRPVTVPIDARLKDVAVSREDPAGPRLIVRAQQALRAPGGRRTIKTYVGDPGAAVYVTSLPEAFYQGRESYADAIPIDDPALTGARDIGREWKARILAVSAQANLGGKAVGDFDRVTVERHGFVGHGDRGSPRGRLRAASIDTPSEALTVAQVERRAAASRPFQLPAPAAVPALPIRAFDKAVRQGLVSAAQLLHGTYREPRGFTVQEGTFMTYPPRQAPREVTGVSISTDGDSRAIVDAETGALLYVGATHAPGVAP